MYRRILGLRRRTNESLGDFMSSLGHETNRHMLALGLHKWDFIGFKRILSWAGHVSRMADYDKTRIAWRCFMFLGSKWLRSQERSIKPNSLKGHQGHGRYLHVWRWEQFVISAIGKDRLVAEASDKRRWEELLEERALTLSYSRRI